MSEARLLSTLANIDHIDVQHQYLEVVKDFRSRETKRLFNGRFSRKLPLNIQRVAARKLEELAAVNLLESLRIPPSKR